jgi:hypothetical protein
VTAAAQGVVELAHGVNVTAQRLEQERFKRDAVKALTAAQGEYNAFREKALLTQDPDALEAMMAELPKITQRAAIAFPFGGEDYQIAVQEAGERTRASLVGHRMAVRRQDAHATAGLVADAFVAEVSQISVAQPELQAHAVAQMQAQIEALNGLSPAEQQARIADAGRAGALSFMAQQIDADPAGVNEMLASEDFAESRKSDALLSFLSEADVAKLRSVADKERIARSAESVSDLEIGVSRGERGYADVQAFFDNKLISGAKRTALFKEIDRQRAGEKIVEAYDNRVMEALAGMRGPLDPRKGGEDRKQVNRFYDANVAPSLAESGASMDQVAAAKADFAWRTGMVPDVVQGEIRGAFRAGNAEQAREAANLLGLLEIHEPALLHDFAERDIALGKHISQLTQYGVAPDRALEMARTAQTQSQAQRNELLSQYSTGGFTAENAERLVDLSGSDPWGPFGDTPLSNQMVGEFEDLTREMFMLTGDIDVARSAAWAVLSRSWAKTEVNGAVQWMKYAPERYYAPGVDPAWIREQLVEELGPFTTSDPKPEDLQLVPSRFTARTAGSGRPVYAVLLRDAEGRFAPVLDADNQAIDTYRPDYETSPAAQREREYLSGNLEEAQRARTGRPWLAGMGAQGALLREDVQPLIDAVQKTALAEGERSRARARLHLDLFKRATSPPSAREPRREKVSSFTLLPPDLRVEP